MPEVLKNPLRGKGLSSEAGMAAGELSHDAEAARALFARCPVAHETPLRNSPELAQRCGVARVSVKDERERMGLGSFKALGAAYAIAKLAAAKDGDNVGDNSLAGETIVCASAGNHGLSLAAGARLFGARAIVFLADTVPESFAERLRALGADVERAGANYEASLEASIEAADKNGWRLLADGTWDGYYKPGRDVMEGYLIMGHEMVDQMDEVPTHLFLQAGVGGLAAGGAVAARDRWGNAVTIVIVEPTAAPALIESVRHDKVMDTEGPVSNMGRLDCKTPSHLALKFLAKEADYFMTVDDDAVADAMAELAAMGLATSPSGGAGLAAAMIADEAQKETLGISASSHLVGIVSEAE